MGKFESGLMLGENELMHEQVRPPQLVAVTDLGSGNRGSISAADITGETRDAFIADLCKPEFWRRTGSTFRCVDGRLPEDGLPHDKPDETYPQGAGGEAVFMPMISYMMQHSATLPLSQEVVSVVESAHENGRKVIIHGDSHKGKTGCLANLRKREILLENAAHVDVVAPRAWFVAQHAGLDAYLTETDVFEMIEIGAENARNDALWDLTPEEYVDAAVAAGAEYEVLEDDHNEKAVLVDLSEEATLDEELFMAAHRLDDGTPLEAFVASVGEFKKQAFEEAKRNGQNEEFAARQVLGFIIFNFGVPKEACAEEKGNGESLPVVIVR